MKHETLLNKLPSLISIFGALILSLSIVYDYGFFTTLGSSFSEMPTTLSDQLRSSLTWIPTTLTAVLSVFVLELFNRRIEQGMTEEEIIQSSPTPKFTAWFRNSPKYLIIALALSVPFALFFDIVLPIQAWQFSLIIIWFLLHNLLFGHERIVQRTSREFRTLIRWVPAILLFIAFQGAITANNIKAGSGAEYVFKLEKTEIVGTLVRTFDKYYLLWNKDKEKIVLLSANKVVQFYPKSLKEKSNKANSADAKSRPAD